jgi:predicted ATPase
VRMAIHAGDAEPRHGDYLAPCLNRLARLLAAGYGGQVLLTRAAQQLARERLPAGATLRDLGEHSLRDLLEPERVFQVLHPDLPASFPPLKTLDRHPTNLPVQPTPLVGRAAELAAVRDLICRERTRLVTLTGPGGTGKTRLALQIAADLVEAFADGVFFVDLAPVADSALVVPTIAATLGLRETGGRSMREVLFDHLAAKHLLLLLDNLEHLLAAAPAIADLLAGCATVTILATSREPLRLRGEREYLVPPLAVPDRAHLPPLSELGQVETVALFVERTRAVRPDFALTIANARAVAEICARLDGLPLAIELAAARTRILEPGQLLARLDNRLQVLTGGARDLPARQRTLRAAIFWSYDLLTGEEQILFRRLSVFAGGFTLEAAECVGGQTDRRIDGNGDISLSVFDGVASLVDKSLLRRATDPGDEVRFGMLETLREFGLARLEEAGETEATRRAHAVWCLSLVEAAEPALRGPDQRSWLERLETEHDNLRAALAWSAAEPELGLKLAGRLWPFWRSRGHLREGQRWLEQLLATGAEVIGTDRARALNGAGSLAFTLGDYARAATWFAENLALRRQLGDKGGTAQALNNLGVIARDRGDHERARVLFEESLALRRELGDRAKFAVPLDNLGMQALNSGDYARAAALLEEALALRREAGDAFAIAESLTHLGIVASKQGDNARAAALFQETLDLRRSLGDKGGAAQSLNNLGLIAAASGDHARAAVLYAESLTLRRELAIRPGVQNSLERLAHCAAALQLAEQAVRLFAAAESCNDALGSAPDLAGSLDDGRVLLAGLRSQLGDATFETAWSAGRALGWDDAVAFALEVAHEIETTSRASASGTTTGSAADRSPSGPSA